jgi:hypothetical protein
LWPDTISNNLWPYAIRKAAHDLNSIKPKTEDLSPLVKFGSVRANIKARDYHLFGCPMYVLNTTGALKGPKWDSKARLAVYIGPSMTHASSVVLELSLQTHLVSPVFHAKYDDTFSAVVDTYGKYVTRSYWQIKCGFSKGIVREPWVDPEVAPAPGNSIPDMEVPVPVNTLANQHNGTPSKAPQQGNTNDDIQHDPVHKQNA